MLRLDRVFQHDLTLPTNLSTNVVLPIIEFASQSVLFLQDKMVHKFWFLKIYWLQYLSSTYVYKNCFFNWDSSIPSQKTDYS